MVVAVVAAVACDSQAGPGYGGEPLATLTGTVVNELALTPSDVEAAVLWLQTGSNPDTLTAERVEVTGDFPHGFRLDVFQPPADDSLDRFFEGEPRVGIALISALTAGNEQEPIGLAEQHVLIYVESDVEPGSGLEALLGGELAEGFHLMEVIDTADPACPDDTFDCLREAEDGFDTEVEVRMADPDTLDVPNWT